MARPRSGDKHAAILNAAALAIAEEGLGASTAKIAKLAGVAEGTLFTYFATKDELLNQVFLEFKRDVYRYIATGFPRKASARVQVQYFWNRYLDWGVANPQKRRAGAQLAVSDKITPQIRAEAEMDSAGCYDVLEARLAAGALKDNSPTFIIAIMSALAEASIDFIYRHPEQAEHFRAAGFDAFWRATGK
jgi:AcrR family transcriptional regulator